MSSDWKSCFAQSPEMVSLKDFIDENISIVLDLIRLRGEQLDIVPLVSYALAIEAIPEIAKEKYNEQYCE